MAMKKADYAEQGRDDALAGNQSRRPSIPGTWQYRAYMDAWEAVKGEQAVPKTPLVAEFRKGIEQASRRVYQDAHRVCTATRKAIEKRQHLKKVAAQTRALSAPRGRDTGYASKLSHNITRGSAWD